ncbi:MAG: formyltransferase family protein [Candidatus ainarchaeum sp.]|nr:formyltransferase family protein [Candidatus ainarchaeum sp.]
MYKVVYIGNIMDVPEFISHDKDLKLEFIIAEEEKLSEDLLTFSIVRNVPLHTVKKSREISALLKGKKIDFCIMCSFGQKITPDTIKETDIYNLHWSSLPEYKGRHPIYWAIMQNEKKLGISLHRVAAEIDLGEIISKKEIEYYLWLNEKDAFELLTAKVPELLQDLKLFLQGKKKPEKNSAGSYYRPVSEAETTISLEKDTLSDIFNKARSQARYKGAKLVSGKKTFFVKKLKFGKTPAGKNLSKGEEFTEKGATWIFLNRAISIKLVDFTEEQ